MVFGVLLAALKYLLWAQLCHEETSMVQSHAALGQLKEKHQVVLLWLSPLKGTIHRDCVSPLLATAEKRCSLPLYKMVQEGGILYSKLPTSRAHDNEKKQTVWALRFQNDNISVKQH